MHPRGWQPHKGQIRKQRLETGWLRSPIPFLVRRGFPVSRLRGGSFAHP
jgi:hypothetical protein